MSSICRSRIEFLCFLPADCKPGPSSLLLSRDCHLGTAPLKLVSPTTSRLVGSCWEICLEVTGAMALFLPMMAPKSVPHHPRNFGSGLPRHGWLQSLTLVHRHPCTLLNHPLLSVCPQLHRTQDRTPGH